jgi:uncharacterized delta-60 repeat protein
MWYLLRHPSRQAKLARHTPPSYRPRLEALEDRCLLSAGAIDPTFGNGGVVTTSLSNSPYISDTAHAVLIQPNGKIVDAGTTISGSSTVMGLARYNANGTLDSTFGKGGIVASKVGAASWDAATLDPAITDASGNEAIVEVGGNTNLALFNPNGSLDTAFGNRGTVTLSYAADGVVVQPDGKIVVDGDNGSAFELTRFNANGTVDTTFGTNGTATLAIAGGVGSEVLVLQPDGKLVVGGEGTWPSTTFDIARFNSNGTPDTSFGNGGSISGSFGTEDVVHMRLAVYPSTGPDPTDYGKIVAACTITGNSANGGGNDNQVALARYNANGTLDNTFGTSGEVVTPFPNSGSMVWGTALQPDGKIVVAGQTDVSGGWDFSLLRYNSNGSLDTSWSNSQGSQIFPTGGLVLTPNGTGSSKAMSVAIQANGDIIAAGATNNYTDFITARYLVGPQIGSFTANPSPVTAGSSVTLTASSIADGVPSSTITQVALYLDSNNDGTLEPGSDTLLGYATQTSPGVWTLISSSAFGLTAGTYTLFAQAQDSAGYLGDPVALTLTVQ